MRRDAWIIGSLLVACASEAGAETLEMGPGDDFEILEAARPGDTVLVSPGTYSFRVHLVQRGTADAPIVIRAADPLDRPVWDMTGQVAEDWPGSGDTLGGCWNVEGSFYVISGVVIRGCRSPHHPVGAIVLDGADHLTLRDALLESNDQGIEGTGENTLVEHCEIAENGESAGTNRTHNLYLSGGGSFRLRSSWVHDSADGANLKLSVREAVIEGNWLENGSAGTLKMETANHGCGTPQSIVFRGNVVVGGAAEFLAAEIHLRNPGAGPDVEMDLATSWNTFVLPAGRRVVAVDNDTMRRAHVSIDDSIVAGTTDIYAFADPSDPSGSIEGVANWLEEGSRAGDLSGTIRGDDPGFVDRAGHDFALREDSPCRGASEPAATDPPQSEFYRDAAIPAGLRLRATAEDLGALESTTTGDGLGPADVVSIETPDLGSPPASECSSCAAGGASPRGRTCAILLLAALVGILGRSRPRPA